MKTKEEAYASMYKRACRMTVPDVFDIFPAGKRTRDRVAKVLASPELTPKERGEVAASYLATEYAFATGEIPSTPTTRLDQELAK